MSSPKVSIIMPSLNVVNFIRECMESVLRQTLRDIEILCVDANSTDGTLEILREYEVNDPRVRVILSDKKSYGYQMNLGMDAASGEYIGIVETDDWAEDTMFETLYNTAVQNHADMVKSNYYSYTTKPEKKNVFTENFSKCPYGEVFSPLACKEIFASTPAIWSGIYQKSMLTEHNIRFNETPGASYQDASFHFMVCTVSQACCLLREAYLHYRRDNESSSVHSPGKVFCVSDEMHYYERFLESRPEYKKQIEEYFQFLKYDKYAWNYDRLAPQFQWEFLALVHREFLEAKEKGLLKADNFPQDMWDALQAILRNPARYYERTSRAANRGEYSGSALSFVRKRLLGAVYCWKEQGMIYTVKHAIRKLSN